MYKNEIEAKIEQEFKDLPENFVVNLVVDQHVYNQVPMVIVGHIMKKMQLKQGLYVSLTKPYEVIYDELNQNNLNADALYYIDLISKETGKVQTKDKVLYLEDPSSITELLLVIKTICGEGKIKFIFLNSLDTLWLYNGAKAVEKFIRSLIIHARKSNVSVILTSPKEENKEDMLASITQFCDKEIGL